MRVDVPARDRPNGWPHVAPLPRRVMQDAPDPVGPLTDHERDTSRSPLLPCSPASMHHRSERGCVSMYQSVLRQNDVTYAHILPGPITTTYSCAHVLTIYRHKPILSSVRKITTTAPGMAQMCSICASRLSMGPGAWKNVWTINVVSGAGPH